MKETDLYPPVKALFEDLGYTVHGEVVDMDVVAMKYDEMIAIELKISFGIKLVTQAALRQKLTHQVYVAIPAPKSKKRFSKSYKDQEYLLRRLSIGLILVKLDTIVPSAEIIFDPKPYNLEQSMKRNKRLRQHALKEISERHGDYNIGGTKGKKVTAYREKALIALYHLSKKEELSVKDLRLATGNEKVQMLLYSNYYNWFQSTKRGHYRISEQGLEALVHYHDIVQLLIQH